MAHLEGEEVAVLANVDSAQVDTGIAAVDEDNALEDVAEGFTDESELVEAVIDDHGGADGG